MFKRMRLTGIAGETISNVKGVVGKLKDVIQLRNTPANLISVGKLFEDEKWLKSILEKYIGMTPRNNTGGASQSMGTGC